MIYRRSNAVPVYGMAVDHTLERGVRDTGFGYDLGRGPVVSL